LLEEFENDSNELFIEASKENNMFTVTITKMSKLTSDKITSNVNTIYKISSCIYSFKNIDNLSEKEQEEKLLSVKGIGPKVTACIMLFGLSRTNRFPIDVWIQRKMQDLYFEGNTKDKETIQKKAEDLFGNYKGYAQQYMFFAGINNII
jgi:3-methyladenine DNA glycosylase/8-oxoguanine DNA glycosylase